MNVLSRFEPQRDIIAAARARIASIDVWDDLAAAESAWRELERGDVLATPYQRFEWLSLWQHHIGLRQGVAPFVVLGRDPARKPLFLLPLGFRRKGPLAVAGFLGGKHTNLNMGLWRRDFAPSVTEIDLRAMLTLLNDSGRRIDLLALLNQPKNWDGIANPLALLKHHRAVEDNQVLTLGAAGEAVLERLFSAQARGKLRTKERKLARLEGYRYARPKTTLDVERYLTAFFAQKEARLRAQGLGNVFAEPGVESFLRAACSASLDGGLPLIELHVLEAAGEVLALFAGVSDGRRFSSMFNSYTLSDHAHWSPGTILLLYLVRDYADRGLRSFDLGLGKAEYKSLFCRDSEALFDSFLPLTPLGRAAATAARSAYALKGHIKRSPRLWSALQAVRRRFR